MKYTKNDGVEWTSVEIKQKKMSTDPKNITLTGLTECQMYTMYTYAENDVGTSYTTENITVTTDCSGNDFRKLIEHQYSPGRNIFFFTICFLDKKVDLFLVYLKCAFFKRATLNIRNCICFLNKPCVVF